MKLAANMRDLLVRKPEYAALDPAQAPYSATPTPENSIKAPHLVLTAVFPADRGTPMVGQEVDLVNVRGIVAAVTLADVGIPRALRPFTPAICVESEVRFNSRNSVRRYLEAHYGTFSRHLQVCAGCFERRVLLLESQPETRPETTAEQGRITAKLAQTVNELSRKVSLTPPDLLPAVSGNVRMALSLLISSDKAEASETALDLAKRLVRAHGLELLVTPPLLIESFPINDFKVTFITFKVTCITFKVICITFKVICITFKVICITFEVTCITFKVT